MAWYTQARCVTADMGSINITEIFFFFFAEQRFQIIENHSGVLEREGGGWGERERESAKESAFLVELIKCC